MYVRNTAGFNFSFKYRDAVILIPFDGKIYSIPDDVEIEKYNHLKVVPSMNVRTQEVTYIRKDGEVASENILGHKRRGRPPLEEQQPKETFIVDVDVDNLDAGEKIAKPKRTVKRPAKRSKPRKV
jgi:hypothetical protein